MTNEEILKDGIRRGRAVGLEEAARVADRVALEQADGGNADGASASRTISAHLRALLKVARENIGDGVVHDEHRF